MSFTEHNVNGLIYDTSDVITAAGSGAVHAFTTRHGGVSPAPYDSLNFADNKGDTSENLLENYRLLGEAVGFDASRAVGCRQIHSDLVRIVSEEDAGKILWDDRPYDADGLITNVPNLPLFAYGTDCCVITLYDPTSRSIGAVHAGWRGTASGIALKAAVSMMSCYGADPYTLRAAIGPSIGKCCFETDSDVADAFFALLDPAMDERIEKRGDKYHIDLKAINRLWLLRAGIDPSRVDVQSMRRVHRENDLLARRHGEELRGCAAAAKQQLVGLLRRGIPAAPGRAHRAHRLHDGPLHRSGLLKRRGGAVEIDHSATSCMPSSETKRTLTGSTPPARQACMARAAWRRGTSSV